MRTVFDNHGVSHIWAQNQYKDGRSNNGNFYFVGPALFSFGPHYLAGFILPDGTALINREQYSISTSQHTSLAHSSALHRNPLLLPDLTHLKTELFSLAQLGGDSRCQHHYAMGWPAMKKRVRAYLAREIAERWETDNPNCGIDPNGAAIDYLLKAFRLPRSKNAILKEAERELKKRKERKAREHAAEMRREIRDLTLIPDTDFREYVSELQDSRFDPCEKLARFGRRFHRAWKFAKAQKGMKRKAALLKSRYKAIRSAINNHREYIRRKVARDRVGHAIDLLQRIKDYERGESVLYDDKRPTLADFWHWLTSGTGARNDTRFRIGSASGAPIGENGLDVDNSPDATALNEAELVTLATRDALQVICENTDVLPLGPTRRGRFRSALIRIEPLANEVEMTRFARLEARNKVHAAERKRQEREKREAWLNGESVRFFGSDENGGAYLRAVNVTRDDAGQVTGGTLETSQGANVPLLHAIRAFRFLKFCRDTGRDWRRNGGTLRVGHYQIDSIEADGSFHAGCHYIRWTRVIDLARALGVDGIEARDVTEKRSLADGSTLYAFGVDRAL